ncbi:MAG: polymer-forming cytoskeletal protein [Candidatus Hydrogenedentes bacterium]|nr:polymer-forming cytoskeletal protein [Candidatus Hydrogenedentota bacterium]
MLDARKRASDPNKIVTIVGQGTAVIGEIKSEGSIRIEGMVSGRVQSDESVVVHDTGKVKAEIVAGQIVISGEVEGNVYAMERLEITAQGRLVGDITAPRVSIAEGVLFEGKCTMKPPEQIKPPQSKTPGQQQQVAGTSPERASGA